jgi:hypothetical protein
VIILLATCTVSPGGDGLASPHFVPPPNESTALLSWQGAISKAREEC